MAKGEREKDNQIKYGDFSNHFYFWFYSFHYGNRKLDHRVYSYNCAATWLTAATARITRPRVWWALTDSLIRARTFFCHPLKTECWEHINKKGKRETVRVLRQDCSKLFGSLDFSPFFFPFFQSISAISRWPSYFCFSSYPTKTLSKITIFFLYWPTASLNALYLSPVCKIFFTLSL